MIVIHSKKKRNSTFEITILILKKDIEMTASRPDNNTRGTLFFTQYLSILHENCIFAQFEKTRHFDQK